VKKTWSAAAVVAGLVVAGVATPAHAEIGDYITITSAKATAAPLKKSGSSNVHVTVRFSTHGDLNFAGSDSDVYIESDAGSDFLGGDLKIAADGRSASADIRIPNDSTPGKWWVTGVYVEANAWDSYSHDYSDWVNDYRDDVASFYVKRATHLSLNAAPEPVAYKEKVTVSGALTRLSAGDSWDPSDARYVPYAGRSVTIYFDPKGSAPKRKVGTATTGSTGRYSKVFTATTTGTWSVSFAGNSSYAPTASGGDSVAVVHKATHLTANAGPEPVRKGRTLTVTGKLTHRTNVRGAAHYTAYSGKKVTIYFNPKGPKGPRAVGTATTNSKGAYHRSFKATVDGTWSAKFSGTRTYGASTSRSDFVDVK
jgi:hypothetical protein